ncbi:cytochrome c family protein [Rhodobacteraceae bacterium]|nr:cytochrome c family protein [Paracoccaceae bacterium]
MSAAPGDLLPTGADDVQVLEDQPGDDLASAASLTGDPLTGDPRAGERVFARCRACHKLDGSNGLGPHLDGVVGRAVASVAGFSYSPALANHGGIWDPAMLDTWLADPRAAIPGNKMTFAGLKDPQDRADVIAYLGGVD